MLITVFIDDCIYTQSPLLSGFGTLGNQVYEGLLSRNAKGESKAEEDEETGESSVWEDESSVNVDPAKCQSILYIQMEYCATTLRKLIDDGSLAKMDLNEIFRLVRQIVEALVYMHSRKIIHRDLVSVPLHCGVIRKKGCLGLTCLFSTIFGPAQKPGNIFLDSEGNIRLGDFGLATRRRDKANIQVDDDSAEVSTIYDAIDDISNLLGGTMSNPNSLSHMSHSTTGGGGFEAMTGGVGTTFYRAPEQEGRASSRTKGDINYNIQADMYSLGIILFEMLHPPFSTVSCESILNPSVGSTVRLIVSRCSIWNDRRH